MKTQDEFNALVKNASPEVRPIVEAILLSSRLDEIKIIDDLLSDTQNRRSQLFDVIYIDLSIDRSTAPLEISGGGTLLAGIDATDNLANITVSLGYQEQDANRRFALLKGKTIRLPFARVYIYHAAQAGKYLKLLRATSLPSIGFGVEDYSSSGQTQDLVDALGNGSSFGAGQVTVPATAGGILIKAANTSRKRITITNSGSNTIFLGASAALTAIASSHALPAGASITLNNTAAIYGIVAAGNEIATYLEE